MMRNAFGVETARPAILRVLSLAFVMVVAATTVDALDIEVLYDDPPGQGFFDAELGELRRSAFQAAIDRWTVTLAGDVPIVVTAAMPRLGGSGASALLASAGATTLHRNFLPTQRDTWYAAPLANQLANSDLNGPDLAEVAITFNADVDGTEVLGSVDWYYGLDAEPGADIDFLTIALHEIGHGLGFLDTINAATGTFGLGDPAILERFLLRPEIGLLEGLLPAERRAAVIAPRDLLWNGPAVTSFNGAPLAVFSPEPFQQGSSLAHWDTELPAPELMQPFYTVANHDFGALLPALLDMGWQLAVPTPTPRAPLATPTPTRPPRPSPTPSRIGVTERELVYVTNFDDSTVSVIDAATRTVVRTVAVDEGPIGIAASSDGTRVYVACFRAGTLDVIRTADDSVIATIPVGESPNEVAATPDGAFVAVTDTAADRIAIVRADSLEHVASVIAGEQPSAIALDGDGRFAFTSNFSGATVTAVDLDAQRRRAIMPVPGSNPSAGLLGIAVAPETGRGYLASFHQSSARTLDAERMQVFQPAMFPFPLGSRPEAVVTNATGTLAYFAVHDAENGTGRIVVLNMADDEVLARILVGLVPEALSLSPDESLLYVANTGNNNVSIVDTIERRAVGVVRVGSAPMGIVAVAVPENQCIDGCETPTATPIARCAGDCDEDDVVSVDELVLSLGIALGRSPVTACPAADANRDGGVSIAEIVGAVGESLEGCGA